MFWPLNPFFDYFNQILGELEAGGFLIYWRKNEINPQGFKRKLEEIGPQVLTMEHLEIGFLVCLFPFGISAIVFVFEIILKCCKTIVSKASKRSMVSIDKTVDLKVGTVETIENNESTSETDENLDKPRLLLSNSTEAKLDTLSENSSIFEIKRLESSKANRNEQRNSAPSQDSLSLLSFQ